MVSAITENNQAEVLKKTRNRERSLLVNVQISMPKEFREILMLPSLRPTLAPGDSGCGAEGNLRVSSNGAIMQSSVARPAAAPEPYRWAAYSAKL